MLRYPHRPTLFPYTTLFRSDRERAARIAGWYGRVAARLLGDGRHRVARHLCRHSDDQSNAARYVRDRVHARGVDRKSTRLNSSHGYISYAVFCLKKKTGKKI